MFLWRAAQTEEHKGIKATTVCLTYIFNIILPLLPPQHGDEEPVLAWLQPMSALPFQPAPKQEKATFIQNANCFRSGWKENGKGKKIPDDLSLLLRGSRPEPKDDVADLDQDGNFREKNFLSTSG